MKFWMRLAVSVLSGFFCAWISLWVVMAGENFQEVPIDPFNFGWENWIASCWSNPIFWGLFTAVLSFYIIGLMKEEYGLELELTILAIFGAASFLLLQACPILIVFLALFFCLKADFRDGGRILWKMRNHGFVMVAGACVPYCLSYGAINGFLLLMAYVGVGLILHALYGFFSLIVVSYISIYSSGVEDDDVAVGL